MRLPQIKLKRNAFGLIVLFPLLWVTAITSCQWDEGFSSPSDPRNLRSLGTFVGKAVSGDTASLVRLIELVNPKMTVLWRGIGLRDKLSSSDQISIDAKAPFAFSLSLLQPPPNEVIDAPEIAFGIFSLYSDQEHNGRFDRLIDPELSGQYTRIDSLLKIVTTAQNNLLAISEIRRREPTSEKFYLERSGAIVRQNLKSLDTLWTLKGLTKTSAAFEYIKLYQRVLGNQNRWELFFSKRKRDNEYFLNTYPLNDHFLGMDIRFDRAVFPKPGNEVLFNTRVIESVAATSALYLASNEILTAAFLTKKLDYPFSGFGLPGQDWMAGRAIQDLLVFFRTQATVDTMMQAALSGSFQFTHLDRIHPGYNLFRCDDQYNCDVRAPEDSITIYLGSTEAYFNAPSTASRNPFTAAVPSQVELLPSTFSMWQGRYALNGSDTISIAIRNDEIWCEATGIGLLRVLPMDTLGFQSPITSFQGIVTRQTSTGLPARLVEYIRESRFVTQALGQPVTAEFLTRINNATGFRRADISDSLVKKCAGKYDYQGDTLRIVSTGGDSLIVTIPTFSATVFHAVNDSLFQCPWGELSLEFQGRTETGYQRLIFQNGPKKKNVPVFNSIPSKLVKSEKIESVGIAWVSENQGSGGDTYLGLDGRKRYSCSQDGSFLRPGDGYLDAFSRTETVDSISLRQGGDALTFRFPGLKDKVVFFQLRNCAQVGAKTKRIRISIWGGSDPANQNLLYTDHQWMGFDIAGSYWSLDSLAINSDPYYLTVKQENTPDAPFHNAFDGYRLGLMP
jgi:hypothetical protein